MVWCIHRLLDDKAMLSVSARALWSIAQLLKESACCRKQLDKPKSGDTETAKSFGNED